MKIDHLDIVSALIKPRLGWANTPDLHLTSSTPVYFPHIYSYDEEERLYWCQEKDGVTDFLYGGAPQLIDGCWQTRRGTGFYGRVFPLQVRWKGEVRPVDVIGPWSGGCYCANKVLTRPACEVIINGVGGYLTLEAIRRILRTFGLTDWNISLGGSLGKLSPELTYKGLRKADWSDNIKRELKEANLDEYASYTLERI